MMGHTTETGRHFRRGVGSKVNVTQVVVHLLTHYASQDKLHIVDSWKEISLFIHKIYYEIQYCLSQ